MSDSLTGLNAPAACLRKGASRQEQHRSALHGNRVLFLVVLSEAVLVIVIEIWAAVEQSKRTSGIDTKILMIWQAGKRKSEYEPEREERIRQCRTVRAAPRIEGEFACNRIQDYDIPAAACPVPIHHDAGQDDGGIIIIHQ